MPLDPAIAAAINPGPLQGIGDLTSFDARNAGTGSAYFERFATLQRRTLKWRRFSAPWTVLDMLQAARGKRTLQALYNLPPRQMIERAQNTADAAHRALITRLRRYVERRFSEQARDGLLAGIAIASAVGGLSAAAGASGPAALAVAAVGFVVGLILGLIDWQAIAVRDAWNRVVQGMTPLERYFTLAGFRGSSSQLCDDEHIPQLPAWQIVPAQPSTKFRMLAESFEAVAKSDCLPEPNNDADRWAMALWLVTALANWFSWANPGETIVHKAGAINQAWGWRNGNTASIGASRWALPFLRTWMPVDEFGPRQAEPLRTLAADPRGATVADALRVYRQTHGAFPTRLEAGPDFGRPFANEAEVTAWANARPWCVVPPMRDLDDCPFSRAFMERYANELRELTAE